MTDDEVVTSMTLGASFSALSQSRSWLQSWADETGLGFGEQRDEMQLVLTELLTNAIEASGETDPVQCELVTDEKAFVLRVINQNPNGNPVEIRKMPDPYSLRGRGLALAQEMSDHLEINAAGPCVDIAAFFNR